MVSLNIPESSAGGCVAFPPCFSALLRLWVIPWAQPGAAAGDEEMVVRRLGKAGGSWGEDGGFWGEEPPVVREAMLGRAAH